MEVDPAAPKEEKAAEGGEKAEAETKPAEAGADVPMEESKEVQQIILKENKH